MTENNSILHMNFGCNPGICEVYSSAVSVKHRHFTVIKEVFSWGNLVITYL